MNAAEDSDCHKGDDEKAVVWKMGCFDLIS